MSAAADGRDGAEEVGFRWLLAGLGALPLMSYLALLGFACAAFISCGRWPTMSYPDPKSLGISFIPAIWLMFAVAACGTPVYLVTVVLQLLHLRSSFSRVDAVGLAAYTAGLALWIFASKDLLTWFLD
ncbi:MAG: hypothetical protein Q7S40_30980 [Opitutaceae bacterium]|nr:hypothetical protein [Opitutaceae bacterium]